MSTSVAARHLTDAIAHWRALGRWAPQFVADESCGFHTQAFLT